MYTVVSRIGGVLVAVVLVSLIVADALAQEQESTRSPQEVRRMLERTIPRRAPNSGGDTRAPQPRRRPAAAGQAAGGNSNSNSAVVDGDTFNFKDAQLREIIEAIGALTGKNFQIDDTVKGTVTLITNTPIPAELAYEVLESILQAQGYGLVPSVDGNIIRVVQTRKAMSGNIPTGVGAEKTAIEGYERFQTQLVPIQFGDASEISQVVSSLMAQDEGSVNVYAPTNTVIITTTVTNLRRLLDIIRQIDVPGFEQQIWIRTLEYARAADLATELDQIFGEQQRAGAQARSRPQVRPVVRRPGSPTARTASQPGIVGAEPTMRIVPDERTNSLIVVATQSMINRISDLIDKLDTSTAFEEEYLHFYPLLNADAKQVADMLNQVTSGVQPRRGTKAGAQQQAELQPFEREVNIVAYEVTNSLLILASPEDYEVLKKIIENLDVLQSQVWVEAVILEVTVTDGFEVGVDVSALYEDDVAAGSAFGTYAALANALAGGPAALPAGGVVGILNGTQTIDVEVVVDQETGQTARQSIVVPDIPAVLTALQTVTDVDVLSAPQLLTADNVESKIVVGQEVPFITGTARPLSQSAQYTSVFSQIRRQDVGITLNVTPQISEGDYVNLTLQVTNSAVSEPPPGTDVNVVGPTLSKSEIKNQIVIQDGHTAVLGGLMSRNESTGRSKVPYLADIPLLGFFFRRTSTTNNRRNLVVFITPTIVKTGEQLAELSKTKRSIYDETRINSLTSQDYLRRFFKKIKRPKRD